MQHFPNTIFLSPFVLLFNLIYAFSCQSYPHIFNVQSRHTHPPPFLVHLDNSQNIFNVDYCVTCKQHDTQHRGWRTQRQNTSLANDKRQPGNAVKHNTNCSPYSEDNRWSISWRRLQRKISSELPMRFGHREKWKQKVMWETDRMRRKDACLVNHV
jgi:hypothetical protein